MKKIALALEKFSRYGGGAESYAVELAGSLINKGWEVHFFGVAWDREPAGAIFHPIAIPAFLPSWGKMLLFALRHEKLLKQHHFDVILGFGNTIAMNVYQSHGGVHWLSTERKAYSENNPLLRFCKRLLIPISMKHHVRHWIESAPFRMTIPPRIIAISDMIRNDYVSYYNVKREKIALVYNGVDPARFTSTILGEEKESIRKGLGIDGGEIVFLFVSYDLEKKGIIPLMRAAARLHEQGLRNFKVLTVGGLPSRRVRRLVRKWKLQDVFLFTGPKKEIQGIFAASDVLTLPTYYDACSLVVFEAMMCGLPAVTTSHNGASGVIEDGKNGFVLSSPPDHNELAEKMALLLDRAYLGVLSSKAAETAKEYTLEKNHEKLIAIFHEVISAEKARHTDGQ